MDADPNSMPDLGDIRREIDEIDGQLLALLQRRFVASERVRIAKLAFGEASGTPLRPAREARLIRRLIAARRDPLPLGVMVGVWRHIIAGSILVQAAASVNMTAETAADGDLREMLSGHFGSMPLAVHDGIEAVLAAVADDAMALAVLPVEGNWLRHLDETGNGVLAVTGTLPFLSRNPSPELLMVSHATSAATGEDETLVLTSGRLPRDFTPTPLWRAKLNGGEWLTSLPGYLSLSEMPLVSLTHGNDDLALRIVGRYPSPIAID